MPSREMTEAITAFKARRASREGTIPPPLADIRAHFAPAGTVHPVPGDVAVSSIVAGAAPAHWLVPPGARADRVVLYLHGGGYSVGSVVSHGELAARVGRASESRVLFLDYRLAPENPFPAAVDDAVAAYHWLLSTQGLRPSSIAVVGDSAGGGLCLSMMVAVRDAGAVVPAAAALMSPWTDLTISGASVKERAEQDVILTPTMVQSLANDYLAGADPRTPLASPLFASLKGLAPLLIQVGTAELLFSDSERLAKTAAEAGVEVTLTTEIGLPHVYPCVLGAPEAAQATEEIGQFLRARMH